MTYDVCVIGSGPGGYAAAIRCSQLGMKTALIEKYQTLGGTCLNVGCIPSKALLDSSELYHKAKHQFKDHGIEQEKLGINWQQMQQRKNSVVDMTCNGLNYLMKKNKIDVYHGLAGFIDKNTIQVMSEKDKASQITTNKAIIATGSKPVSLPGLPIDKKKIISSTEAIKLTEIPDKLIIVGGGVIGLELGSVYARLGSKITVIEFLDSLIPTMDRSLGKELQRLLKKLGFDVFVNHKVIKAEVHEKEVLVTAKNKKGQTVDFQGNYCLVVIGRKPYTEGLGLDKIGIKQNNKGCIEVNEHLETSVQGIYAIGDVIKGPMLAHKAEEEGIFVAETLAGQKPHINYRFIPEVVYVWPEIAGVGFTEEELKAKSLAYKTGSFSFKASARARASMDTDGFVKVLADKETDEILGIHIIGPRAADLIAEAVTALEYRASAEDLARMSHAHPTFSEAIKEACLAARDNRAIHA